MCLRGSGRGGWGIFSRSQLGMSDACMDRQRQRGFLLQTLLVWTVVGLCCAGHRPYQRGERPRYPRQHDRWYQRIQYPSLHDRGNQHIVYPSANEPGTQGVRDPFLGDRGQTVQYPSFNDSDAGAQFQVNLLKSDLIG